MTRTIDYHYFSITQCLVLLKTIDNKKSKFKRFSANPQQIKSYLFSTYIKNLPYIKKTTQSRFKNILRRYYFYLFLFQLYSADYCKKAEKHFQLLNNCELLIQSIEIESNSVLAVIENYFKVDKRTGIFTY